jgi:hypothetical protein
MSGRIHDVRHSHRDGGERQDLTIGSKTDANSRLIGSFAVPFRREGTNKNYMAGTCFASLITP